MDINGVISIINVCKYAIFDIFQLIYYTKKMMRSNICHNMCIVLVKENMSIYASYVQAYTNTYMKTVTSLIKCQDCSRLEVTFCHVSAN